MCDFLDTAGANLVEPGISDMPDHSRAVLNHGHGENASHAGPLRIHACEPKNFIIGDSNGLADPLRRTTGLSLEAAPNHAESDVGSFLARSMPADAIDDEKKSTL